jgi:preprotein translocase subunit YajC
MAPPGGQGGGGMETLVMMSLIIIVFYFFMIRPQAKRAKNERLFRESLKKGDKVITIGGMHGKIVDMNDKTILVEVDNNVKIRIERSAVSLDATKQLEKAASQEKS